MQKGRNDLTLSFQLICHTIDPAFSSHSFEPSRKGGPASSSSSSKTASLIITLSGLSPMAC